MSKSTIAIVLLTLLLVISNGLWVLDVLDRAVGRTHRASQVAIERDSARLLADLVLASNLPLDRARLDHAIDALPESEDLLVQQEGDALYVSDIGFVLEGDRVTRIHFMWEPSLPSAASR